MSTPQSGDRIRLVHTDDEWTRLRPGALGTVRSVDDNHTVHTDWDDGSRLGLSAASGDRWDVVGWRVSVGDHSYHVTNDGWCDALQCGSTGRTTRGRSPASSCPEWSTDKVR